MDKDFLIRLTVAVYKVSSLLPKGALRSRIEKLANEVLLGILFNKEVKQEIEELQRCLETAQNNFPLVDKRNFLVLQKEYNKLLLSELSRHQEDKNNSIDDTTYLSAQERQLKILEIFRQKKNLQLGELMKHFPLVNRRTILRDLSFLQAKGFIEKMGKGRGAFYRLSQRYLDIPNYSKDIIVSEKL